MHTLIYLIYVSEKSNHLYIRVCIRHTIQLEAPVRVITRKAQKVLSFYTIYCVNVHITNYNKGAFQQSKQKHI